MLYATMLSRDGKLSDFRKRNSTYQHDLLNPVNARLFNIQW